MSKATKKKNFKQIVEATPDIAAGYVAGLQALGQYSKLIALEAPRQCEGSVDIDASTRAKYPTDNRWDYVLGYNGASYFVEVHSA